MKKTLSALATLATALVALTACSSTTPPASGTGVDPIWWTSC